MSFRWNRFAAIGLMAFLSTPGIMAEEFDFGGVTFDFQKISDQRFKVKPVNAGNNPVLNGDFKKDKSEWSCTADVHLLDKELASKLKGQIKPLVEFKIVDLPEGGKAAYTRKPLELEGICGESTARVSGSWRQTVKMPDMAGGSYNINFRYKGAIFGKYKTSCVLLLLLNDSSGKSTLKELRFSNPGQEWQNFSMNVQVPPNTATIAMAFRIDGTGEIYFTDVQIQKGSPEMPLSVCLGPMSFLDNTFCLSQNDPAVMAFIWRKNLPKDKVDLKNPVLNVQLPESVQVKAVRDGLKLISSEAVTVDGKPYKLHKIDLSADRARPLQTEGYDFYLTQSLLVFTNAAAGAALADGSCWVSDNEKQLTDKGSFHLKVIPSIRLSAKPDIFMNGIDIGGPYLNFPGNENRDLLTSFIGGTGTAWLIGKFDVAVMESYRRNGVKIITPTLYWINDGYLLGDPKDRLEYAKFKYLGETTNKNLLNATCPVAIYLKPSTLKNP
jgi:hypothetical protein